MNVRNFLRNALGEDTGETTDERSGGSTSGVSNFLSGTSRLLDTVQAKKNDLLQDISSKLTSIKMPTGESPVFSGGAVKKKVRTGSEGQDESSSASEYGDDGDNPMYAEQSNLPRDSSVESFTSLPDEQTVNQWKENIGQLVASLLEHRPIEAQLEVEFQNYILRHSGRSMFAYNLKSQLGEQKKVASPVLKCLTPFVSQVMDKCLDAHDFSPATTLAHLCFTIYYDVHAFSATDIGHQVYLYQSLSSHAIWQSMRFWNAAYFITLQAERRHLTIPAGLEGEDALRAEKEMQEGSVYVNLSKFIWRMFALGIRKENCMDFLRKQADEADLSKDTFFALQSNLRKFYQTKDTENE